jgi:glucuronoarabinoxylan endo-1,4-beta-xylanase
MSKVMDGNTYTISGWVKLGNSASDTIKLSVEQKDGNGTKYIGVASGTGNDTGWTKLSGTFTLSVTGTLSTLDIYFEGPASGVILYVDDANVYGPPIPPAPPAPRYIPEANSINLIHNPKFEYGTTGWSARGNGSDCKITTVTNPIYEGSYSAKAYNRGSDWHGIKQSLLGKMQNGKKYAFSGWVRLDNIASDTVRMSIEQKDGNGTKYHTIDSKTGSNSNWIELYGDFTLSVNGTLTTLDVYFEGPAADVNIFVDDVNVCGPAPVPPTADSNTVAQVNITTRYQTLEGFGAAGAWYENWITNHPQKNTLYNIMFSELGLDIYRLRNAYDQSGGTAYINNSAEIVQNAEASLGHPVKILISSWSPPAYLKSDSNTVGGTLAKDTSGNYKYNEFAQWWLDSLNYWAANGVVADYASMQNEPDYTADWDTCKFGTTQSSSVAGYNLAFQAFYTKIAAMTNPPKLLAPEAVSISNSKNYLKALTAADKTHLYGYAHHLYGDGSVDSPDGYISAMTSFASQYSDKPRFQTEFSKGTDVTLTFATDAMNLAKLMHNALTIENAASYIYWELFWAAPKGLVGLTSNSYNINPVYYAFKHFSAFTDPGWQRVSTTIGSSDIRTSAYISPDNNKLSIILINTSTSSNIAVNFSSLSGFTPAGGYLYRSSAIDFCKNIGTFNTNEYVLLPKTSITTIALTSEPENCQQVQDFGFGLAADLNGDCSVNSKDLLVLAGYWLRTDCDENNNCGGADFELADGTVDFLDFTDFAEQWMQCNNPQREDCITN